MARANQALRATDRNDAPPEPPAVLDGRPNENVTALLVEDVTYPDWEFESAAAPRFYVTGFSGFRRRINHRDVLFLTHFTEAAFDLIEKETDWTDFPAPWDRQLSYNQFRALKRRMPVLFYKAAQVIVTCEMALRNWHIKEKNVSPEVAAQLAEQEIYANMRILPAVYNIDKFSLTINSVKAMGAQAQAQVERVLAECEQEDPVLLDEMAEGYCVTKRTADAIVAAFREFLPQVPIGAVRDKPGKRVLGRKRASNRENVFLDSDGGWLIPSPADPR